MLCAAPERSAVRTGMTEGLHRLFHEDSTFQTVHDTEIKAWSLYSQKDLTAEDTEVSDAGEGKN